MTSRSPTVLTGSTTLPQASVHNADIARCFEEIADILDIGQDNPFRIRAYRNAARVIADLRLDLAAEIRAGHPLPKLPGIGTDLAQKIHELASTGHCQTLERLRRQVPAAVLDMLHLPGLGPKRVHALYHELGIHSLAELVQAAREGRLRTLHGFGEKTEARLLQAAQAHLLKPRRYKLAIAVQYAEPLAAWLRATNGIGEVCIAGSLRRMRETVGDIDIIATAPTASAAAAVIDRFIHYPEVKQVLSSGPTRSSVVLASGMQADLRVVPPQSHGAALHYFTGSRAHNIAIRRLAQARGLKLNEYGLFQGRERVNGATEESVFAAVGLPWIPPELREASGEIEAARAGRLPLLVERDDLQGDLHAHTRWSDGHHSIREMAEAARARGLRYLAITDHSSHLGGTIHGLDARRLEQQVAEIEATQVPGITLLKGIEVDILEDGSLDMPDRLLEQLDIVVGAVHSRFQLSRERQTARILRALDHPLLNVLAHPLGRLIGEREPYQVDMPRIIRKAAARGCFLELNASPERLDLHDAYCRMARNEGVLVAVSSDAHSTAQFDNLAYGIGQARRGWLEKRDVLNTRALPELLKLLRRAPAASGAG